MDVNAWIEEIHRNKHNMIPVVKLAVFKPIECLCEPANLTTDFPSTLFEEIKEKKELADSIMSFLSSIGNISCQESEIVACLENQIKHVTNVIVPQIESFASFFLQFKDKDFYFADSEDGNRAKTRVEKAPHLCEISCQGLLKLSSEQRNDDNLSANSVNIIEILQDAFDEIDNATVIYHCNDRKLETKIDEGAFISNVLINLCENIKRHAFPQAKFMEKLVVDKIVAIVVTEKEGFINIRISNNGLPFKGNISKLFDAGYHAGEFGRTGYGLSTAKKYLSQIGGDVVFSPIEDFEVSFLITIPKI